MNSVTCREIGCGGASCKYYKPIAEYPFYRCMYQETENENEDKEDSDEHE
jgi:hypothetical protein